MPRTELVMRGGHSTRNDSHSENHWFTTGNRAGQWIMKFQIRQKYHSWFIIHANIPYFDYHLGIDIVYSQNIWQVNMGQLVAVLWYCIISWTENESRWRQIHSRIWKRQPYQTIMSAISYHKNHKKLSIRLHPHMPICRHFDTKIWNVFITVYRFIWGIIVCL